MKVSVIVPVYNVEKYLENCIDSLVNQSLKEIEIICVNDGSTDNSLDIIRKYEENYNNIIVIDKENGGLSDARNHGIEVSNGEYIAFVDSDDWVELDMLELMYQKAIEEEAEIVTAGYKEVYSDKIDIIDDYDIQYKIIYEGTVWNKIFKKSLIQEYNLRFPKGLWYEDNAFTYRALIVANKIVSVKKAFYNYRKDRVGSIMNTQKNNKIYDMYKIGDIIYDFNIVNCNDEEICKQLEYVFIKVIFFRQIPKIINLEKGNIRNMLIKLNEHIKYLDYKFINWESNSLFKQDIEGYFRRKLRIAPKLKFCILKLICRILNTK